MMRLKCFILALSLFVCVQTASITNKRNIHVQVVYDRPEDVPHYGVQIDKRNLQEKNQLTAEEIKKEELEIPNETQKIQMQAVDVDQSEPQKSEEKPIVDLLAPEDNKQAETENQNNNVGIGMNQDVNLNSIKNLDEKVQLSRDQLKHSAEHIPEIKDVKQEMLSEQVRIGIGENQNEEPVKAESPINLMINQANSNAMLSKSNLMINNVQDIIYTGIRDIKRNIERYMASNNNAQTIDENVWKHLNSSVDNFITMLKDNASSKQDAQNQTFFQTVVTGFQTLGSNFLQNVRPNNTEGDEQQPGFGQNVINFFSGGFQQISENLSGIGSAQNSNSTVLGDTDTTGQAPNPVAGFISQVQNFFGNPSQINPIQNLQSNQSDPVSEGGSSQQPGFFQNAVSQIGQAFNNINVFQSSTSKPPEGDESSVSSTQQPPLQLFQNTANQIGQAISNANPFRPSTQRPGSEGDEEASSSSQQPLQLFQNTVNQIGQAINNANPFRPSTQSPNSESDEQTTQNQPFQFIQNVFGGIYQQGTRPPSSQGDASSTQAPNPIISGIQGAGAQVQQFFNQTNVNPAESIQNPFANSSFTPPSFENIGSQFSDAVTNFTPPSNPIEAVQNAVSQASDSINSSSESAVKAKPGIAEEIMLSSEK